MMNVRSGSDRRNWSRVENSLIIAFLMLTCVSCGRQQSNATASEEHGANGPPFAMMRGVNYISWTASQYPFCCSFQKQTYHDSQGITDVSITTERAGEGRGALEAVLGVEHGSKTHENGEIFVDLRHTRSYQALRSVQLKRTGETVVGVDLSGKTVGCLVFCEKGTGGSTSAPNGLQVVLKSLTRTDGKEVWGSYYGNWHNIWIGSRYWKADRALGDVREGAWSLVTVKVPQRGTSGSPQYGDADASFDPSQVALIGLKFGANPDRSWGGAYEGKKIWIDNFGFKDIISEDEPGFDFSQIPHPLDVEAWCHFGTKPVAPLELKPGGAFGKPRRLVCSGNSVFFDFEQAENPVASLRASGFDTIGIVNTEYMEDPTSTAIVPKEGKSHTMEELDELIKQAKSEGLRIVLKPHVDVVDDTWRGEIKPNDTNQWFEAYRAFILKYARLAERHEVEILVVGTEFKSLEGEQYQEQWRQVVRSVREVYSGLLTYAANWDAYDFYLWQDLDLVGIDAYFPLSDLRDPSLAELVAGWSSYEYDDQQRNWLEELRKWQASVGKDIIFTEIGFRSTDFAAREPWEFEEVRPVNLELQKRCYQSVFEAFEHEPWFKGTLFWYWSPRQDAGGSLDIDFTPQHKPAQHVFVEAAS